MGCVDGCDGTEILPGGVRLRWQVGAMTSPLPDLLTDLAALVAGIPPEQYGVSTPCPEYDVAALRDHVLGWLPVFAAALADPDGAQPRPDPTGHRAPSDPSAATAEVADVGKQVAAALDDDVAERPVHLFGQTPLPGSMVVGMLTAEVIAHGWDLARATGRPWDPSPTACVSTLGTLRAMLTPEYRGPGRGFGVEVPAPDAATNLDRLLAFTGRDPNWAPGH